MQQILRDKLAKLKAKLNQEYLLVSLFNGISGTSQALKNIGIIPKRTYISEIDKYSNTIAKTNFPNSIQLGTILDITDDVIEKINQYAKDNNLKVILVAGFPCQGFSLIGHQKGMSTEDTENESIDVTTLNQYKELKNKGYKFDGQSYLFWEMMMIKKKLSYDYFLGENVKMAKKWLDVIDTTLGHKGQYIDSRIVSPQSRKRYYWTENLTFHMPRFECELVTNDILEDNAKWIEPTPHLLGEWNKKARLDKVSFSDGKCHTITASGAKSNHSAWVKTNTQVHKLISLECERLQGFPDGFTNSVSKTRALKALGNSFNVPTIERFFYSLSTRFDLKVALS